ncbi:MAG: HDIG domain-containing protein [Polyangiaceae bacterium]
MHEQATQTGDGRRAMAALEWAASIAERPRPDALDGTSSIAAAPLDFQVALACYPSDLRKVLDRVMMSDDAEAGLDALLACGALSALMPEVQAMVGFGDGEWRHKDVWKHTKQVVRQAVPRLEVRWAALLHDIGKIKTRSISPDGEVHFFGHAEVGARMFDKMNRRLPIFASEASLRDSVRFLILHHLRASQYDASWTDSAVRRFAREMGDSLDDLLCLSRADITTKRPEKKKKGLRQISELADRVRVIAEQDAQVPPLPSGIGDAIMASFAIPPSRLIGEIKRKLELEIEAGELTPHLTADDYIAILRANPAKYGLPV